MKTSIFVLLCKTLLVFTLIKNVCAQNNIEIKLLYLCLNKVELWPVSRQRSFFQAKFSVPPKPGNNSVFHNSVFPLTWYPEKDLSVVSLEFRIFYMPFFRSRFIFLIMLIFDGCENQLPSPECTPCWKEAQEHMRSRKAASLIFHRG